MSTVYLGDHNVIAWEKLLFLWVNIYTLLFTNADLPQNPVIGSAIKKKSMWVLHDQNDCQLFDLEYAQV